MTIDSARIPLDPRTLELIERLTSEAEKRGLEFLLIGGQAMIQHGYERLTLDVDFLGTEDSRGTWREVLARYGYQVVAETPAFEQFAHTEPGWPQVDIMFVNPETWSKLRGEAEAKVSGRVTVHVPSPSHMVALKLHAASSPQRENAEKDWNDILQLVRRHHLDPNDEKFAALVTRYGGTGALDRLKKSSRQLS